ncbi:hypothetical protein BGW80DRAFT_657375 [Lactifluus volemus]|nr:hypothetical protein BGW80DRAFT_657375 [Lactifluus volemus]
MIVDPNHGLSPIPTPFVPPLPIDLSFPISTDGIFEAEGEMAECSAVLPNGKSNEQHQEVRSVSQYAAIERLPDEVIREIFIFDRLIFISRLQSYWPPRQPWEWHKLVHVCRRWRHIIFDSSRSLNLQLLCTHGTPVKNNLDYWPALPIVMQYPQSSTSININYSNPISEISDADNIMAALQHSDRIYTIWLNVTTPLLEKLTTVPQDSFPALEYLVLETGTDNGFILPEESFVGPFPNLHVLHVARIAFPALQRVLLSARDLVDLHLETLPSSGYITPAALLTFLPVMTRLESLFLDFRSPISRPILGGYRPAPQGHAVLLALKWFTFSGVSEDLECLLSGIDAPGIVYINVTFFNQATMFDTSQLLQFISRTQTFILSSVISEAFTSTKFQATQCKMMWTLLRCWSFSALSQM